MRKFAAGLGVVLATMTISAEARDRCVRVFAELEERQVTENCTSPNNYCAAGTIDGNLGLHGTTFFTVDGAVRGPASSPGSGAYSGVLEFSTARGTLVLRETGVTVPGLNSSVAEVTSGTGRFANATGVVYFRGANENGLIKVKMSGELCFVAR